MRRRCEPPGAPLRISTFEANEPYITGAPGFTICASVITARISAVCCTRVPAMVAGLIAPASVNGVMQVTCPLAASSSTASVIGISSCSGELVFTMASIAGSRASSSRSMPSAMQCIAMQSRVRSRPST
ncbi:MAG: hypothetical protein KBG75_01375 [Pseudomonadales bacterium]|nr:hypothetical protein [Pseudomonadales bacterium]